MEPGLLLFAFTAGAAAFFAPCCVAMLPAYVAYAVDTSGAPQPPETRYARLGRATAVLGMFPLAAGLVPLVAIGISSIVPSAAVVGPWLPGLDASLTLLFVGVGLAVAGLFTAGRGRAIVRGALFGLLAGLGFFAVFLVVGLPLAFLARGLRPYLPWLALVVGVALVVLGILLLTGRGFAPRFPTPKADVTSPKGFFLFGAGYAIAGLSCTFPVFLGVMAAGALAGGAKSTLGVFAAYALGKSTLLVGLTAVTVAGSATAGQRLKRLTPHIARASAVLLVVAGAYIAWYYGRYAPGLGP